jgi:hypothetical protein
MQVAGAQSESDDPALPEDPVSTGSREWPLAGVVTVLFPILLPKILGDVTELKEFIRSEEFARLRRRVGDNLAVDLLFNRARELSWGNAYEALLISTVATFEHRRFGVRVPLLGPLVWIALTAEFEDDFRARLRSLPSRLYVDTPPGMAGDRDKLQHFFGSAFLTYLFESMEAADRVGEFVEWGEERFIVDGVNDERDRRANLQGQEFGMRLLEEPESRPSAFLRSEVAESLPEIGSPCGRGSIPRAMIIHLEEQ